MNEAEFHIAQFNVATMRPDLLDAGRVKAATPP
jgi:hypothetical protein